MTEHVLAGDQHIAVALIDKACEGPLRGVAQVAGLGRIVHHERLPDGRFHVLLQGVGRVGFLEELPMGDLLYRRARADVLSPQAAGDEASALADEVTTLRSCYARLLDAHPECKDTLGDLPLRITDPAVLADIVCAALLDDLPARQAALEEKSLVVRLKTANNALATLLLRSLSCSPSSVN